MTAMQPVGPEFDIARKETYTARYGSNVYRKLPRLTATATVEFCNAHAPSVRIMAGVHSYGRLAFLLSLDERALRAWGTERKVLQHTAVPGLAGSRDVSSRFRRDV